MLPMTKLAVGVNIAVAIAELLVVMLAVALCRVGDSVVVSVEGTCSAVARAFVDPGSSVKVVVNGTVIETGTCEVSAVSVVVEVDISNEP